MKSWVLVGMLLISTVLVITTGFDLRSAKMSQSGNARLNVKDLERHGLVIITSSDQSFDAMVATLLKGKEDPVVASLAPYSVFIKNTTNRTVVACVLKWEMLQPNGQVRTVKTEYTNLLALMGNDIGDTKEGLAIKPDSNWFFTPSHLQMNQDESGLEPGDTTGDSSEMMKSLDRVRSELTRYLSITITLDGAFFNDGTFVGPNTTGFFSKVEAMRNAKRDLFQEIDDSIKHGKSRSDLFKHLEEIASKPKVELSNSSQGDDYYRSFKRDAAAELLRIRKGEGDEKTIQQVQKKVQKPWPELHKV